MSRWGEEESSPAAARTAAPVAARTRTSPLLDGPVITRLVAYMAVAMLIGVLLIVAARFMGAAFYPVPTLVVAALVGAIWWAVMMVADWPPYERWEPAAVVDPSLRVASDPRTRRLEGMLSGADAKHRMSTRDVARTLSAVASDTLVRSYGADPADPLAAAEGRLSPDLVAFLRADPDAPTPILTRRVLHAWLTEMDTLTRKRG